MRCSLAAFGLLSIWATACDGGKIPLSVEVNENAAGGASPDSVELVAKTVPGVTVTFGSESKDVGALASASFLVAKKTLKLGKNAFALQATKGGLFGKASATATAEWNATPKTILRFTSAGGDSQAAYSCTGTMCGASSFRAQKNGVLPIAVESRMDVRLVVDGTKVPVAAGAKAKVDVDLRAKIAGATVGSERISIPVKVEGGGAADESLDLDGPILADLAAADLAKVASGGVSFPGEAPPVSGPPKTLLVVGVPSTRLVLVGKPGTFHDVDLVAVAKPTERFFGCGKTDAAGILYTDLDVTVYERRSGKKVGTRKLRADRVPCPDKPTGGQAKGDVREDDVKRVLGEFLK